MKMSGEVLAMCKALTGVSADAIVTCGKISFRENLLFTHRGLSGPAILQISSYWSAGESIAIDLLPEVDAEKFLRDRRRSRPRAEVKTVLGELLPARLADSIASSSGAIANLADERLMAIAARLNRWRVVPLETEGWAKAEVTTSGIDSRALSSRTMEARDVPGLFFIGEAVDVTGWLGGTTFSGHGPAAGARGRQYRSKSQRQIGSSVNLGPSSGPEDRATFSPRLREKAKKKEHIFPIIAFSLVREKVARLRRRRGPSSQMHDSASSHEY